MSGSIGVAVNPGTVPAPDIIGNQGRLADIAKTQAGIGLIGAQTQQTQAQTGLIGAQTTTESQRPALIKAQSDQATAAAAELLERANNVDPATAAQLRAQASNLLATAGMTVAQTYPLTVANRQTAATEKLTAPAFGYGVTAPPPPGMESFEGALGRSEARTPQTVNKGGYSGQFGFGAERLADPGVGVYTPSPGENLKANQWTGTFNIPGHPEVVTYQDFLNSSAAQHVAFGLHVQNIDRNIAATPGAEAYDQNGLRAVAHLGGISGMQKFVATGGAYNPGDDPTAPNGGTHLSDYYTKFAAGGAPALQAAFGSPHGPGGPPPDGAAPAPQSAPAPNTAPPAAATTRPVQLPGMSGPVPALLAVQPGGFTGTPEQRQAFQTQRANNMATIFSSAPDESTGVHALASGGYLTPAQRDNLLANPGTARNFIAQQLPIAEQPTPGIKAQIERDTPLMAADLSKNEANVDAGMRAATDQYNLKNIKGLVDDAPDDLLGAAASTRLAIQKYAEQFGGPWTKTVSSALTGVGSLSVPQLQDLQKAFLSNVLANERTQGVARIGAMSTQYFQKASPSIDMTKPAVKEITNLALVGQQMTRDFADASNNYYSTQRDATNDSLVAGPYQRYQPITGLEKQWLSPDSSHGPDVYAAAANLMNGVPQAKAFKDFDPKSPIGRAKMVEAINIMHRTDPGAVTALGFAPTPAGQ